MLVLLRLIIQLIKENKINLVVILKRERLKSLSLF